MKRNRKQQQDPHFVDQHVIEGFLGEVDQIFQANQNNPYPPFPYDKTTNSIRLPGHLEQELRLLRALGQKVEAVKRVTQLTGAGLRVSKDYVDNL